MQVARTSGTRLRGAGMSGALLACAALSLPAAQRAAARPYEPPVPSPSATAVPAAAPAATGTTAAAPGPGPAVPSPSSTAQPDSLPDLLDRLRTLYQQAEAATEAYDRARETAGQQRAKAEALDTQLAAQRSAVAAGRDRVGLIARQLYRTGGLSPYLTMLGGETPQDVFGLLHVTRRAVGHELDVAAGLAAGENRLAVLNAQAQRALDAAQVARNRQAAQKEAVETRLRQVEGLLAGLSGEQISRLRALGAVRPDPGAPPQEGNRPSTVPSRTAQPVG